MKEISRLAEGCLNRSHTKLNEAIANWLEGKLNDQQFCKECAEIGQWLVDNIGGAKPC